MTDDEPNLALRTKRLRLSPDDVVLLWGIVDGFMERNGKEETNWPRLSRIYFDLSTMMAEQENAHAD